MANGIEIRLFNGATAQASLTGLTCLWWDAEDVYDFGAPQGRTDVATTDADGDLILDLSNVSGHSVGGIGYLLVRKEDLGDHEDSLVFQGKVTVSSITGGTLLVYNSGWVRPADWLTMPTIATGDYKFAGLFAVYDTPSSLVALLARGAYTVDWGDGSATENIADNVQAEHQYDYDDTDLDGTEVGVSDAVSCTFTDTGDWVNLTDHGWLDGQRVTFSVITTTTGISINKRYFVKSPPIACTFADSGDLVTSAGHGFVNDERIRFYSITTTTGITKAITYYIVNKTTDDFQVSLTQGGAAVALTTNGSGSFYPVDKFQLADTIGGSAKALTTDGSGSVFAPLYRQAMITVVPQGAGSTFTTIDLARRHTTASAVVMDVPWLELTVCGASLSSMILRATTPIEVRQIQHVKILDHNQVNWSSMFAAMGGLRAATLPNTSSVNNLALAFNGCSSLEVAPGFDTQAVTTFSNAFNGASSLRKLPLYNTSLCTAFNNTFQSCSALQEVPSFDLSKATNLSAMFQSSGIRYLPELVTPIVTSISNMLWGCPNLVDVPLFDTSRVTAASNFLSSCQKLQNVPAFDLSAVTSLTGIFLSSDAIGRIECKMPAVSFSVASLNLGPAALDEIYTNLPTASATITVTGNYGTSGDDPTIATAKGWTVTS